jgi:hypothetical protein
MQPGEIKHSNGRTVYASFGMWHEPNGDFHLSLPQFGSFNVVVKNDDSENGHKKLYKQIEELMTYARTMTINEPAPAGTNVPPYSNVMTSAELSRALRILGFTDGKRELSKELAFIRTLMRARTQAGQTVEVSKDHWKVIY